MLTTCSLISPFLRPSFWLIPRSWTWRDEVPGHSARIVHFLGTLWAENTVPFASLWTAEWVWEQRGQVWHVWPAPPAGRAPVYPGPISAPFSFLLRSTNAVSPEACGQWSFSLLLILTLTVQCFTRLFCCRGFRCAVACALSRLQWGF